MKPIINTTVLSYVVNWRRQLRLLQPDSSHVCQLPYVNCHQFRSQHLYSWLSPIKHTSKTSNDSLSSRTLLVHILQCMQVGGFLAFMFSNNSILAIRLYGIYLTQQDFYTFFAFEILISNMLLSYTLQYLVQCSSASHVHKN